MSEAIKKKVQRMRIGIGLPVAVPGFDARQIGQWASRSEELGFCSLGVIDRLVYDNLEPLVALSAAAATTQRLELMTTILNVLWRQNAVLLAKQLVSLDQASGRRLTAGLGFGGWPEDYVASEVPYSERGQRFERMIASMQAVWRGEVAGASGPMTAQPAGRPRILIGGLAPPSFERVARYSEGWVAPSFGLETLKQGVASVRSAWESAAREGQPRIVTLRYFCLGAASDEHAARYLAHYYGEANVQSVLQDTATSSVQLQSLLGELADADCDDVVLVPCRHELGQVELLAAALDSIGIDNRGLSGMRTR
jgi:alkanesulfonate monooxygenase SsuD/methylene tetrahydromethanopterin reductase-like flavin-dependent oxidoreductase (luciferase family)